MEKEMEENQKFFFLKQQLKYKNKQEVISKNAIK